jgi:hypothetical protein
MNTELNGEPQLTNVTSADRARSANTSALSIFKAERPVLAVNTAGVVQTTSTKALAPLFTQGAATEFRSRWDAVQRSFVDDPQEAVRAGDELVAHVIKSLTETFSSQRTQLEVELKQAEKASTENLRLALRRYRSFFERLLSI